MRRPAAAAWFAAALGLVALGGCVDPDPSSPTAEDLDRIDLSADHTVSVDESGFHPADSEIPAGSVVRLVNAGEEPHSFTAEDGRFDTGRLLPGDETTLVLTAPGPIELFDLEAPDHTGTLTVTGAADG